MQKGITVSDYQLESLLFNQDYSDLSWRLLDWQKRALSDGLIDHRQSELLFGKRKYSRRSLYRGRFQILEAFGGRISAFGNATNSAQSALSSRQSLELSRLDSIFRKSHYLGIKPIAKGEGKTLTFTVPQVPGRWKLVHVAANTNQYGIAEQTLTASLPVELHLNAPTDIVSSDVSKVTVTAINRQEAEVMQSVTLWVNGKEHTKVPLPLKAAEQRLLTLSLPQLERGTHQITLSLGDSVEPLALKTINVVGTDFPNTQNYLYQSKDTKVVSLPDELSPGSLKLLASPVTSSSPDWLSQTQHLENYPHQCWEQNLSRYLSYQFAFESNKVWPEGKAKLSKLLSQSGQYQTARGGFAYFPGRQEDAFLTAYTEVVRHWLGNDDVFGLIDILPENIKAIATQSKDHQARGMALLALSSSGRYSLPELLAIEKDIQGGIGLSDALKLLSLQTMGADAELIESRRNTLLRRGYQSQGSDIAGGNGSLCFNALALGKSHSKSQHLMEQVTLSQWQQGHFGSTFADGVCSYLLQDRKVQGAGFQPLNFSLENGVAKFEGPDKQAFWLKQQYAVPMTSIKAKSQGLSLNRHYFVKRGVDWQPLTEQGKLSVGDIIKIELLVDVPSLTAHVALNERMPGGFEAVNSRVENQFSNDLDDENQPEYIQQGYVRWYPGNLTQGLHRFVYYAKVRYPGRYLAPPAKVEAMYDANTFARTGAIHFEVE